MVEIRTRGAVAAAPTEDAEMEAAAGTATAPTGSTPLTQEQVTALIEEHMPLVNHVVFQVAVHVPGLVEAAKRFDGSRGVPFNRFAAQRIRGAIIDAVRAADWAPRSVRALARRLDQVEQGLANRLGRVPSLAETAQELNISRDELDRLRDRLFRSVVLAFDSLLGDSDDEELTLVDVLTDRSAIEPSEELEARELRAYLRDAVELLPERHRIIVVGYFIEERTSTDLARFLGVTESRVSQMRTEALAMLRGGIEAQYEDERPEADGLVARRRARYAEAISSASGVGDRISPLCADTDAFSASSVVAPRKAELVGAG